MKRIQYTRKNLLQIQQKYSTIKTKEDTQNPKIFEPIMPTFNSQTESTSSTPFVKQDLNFKTNLTSSLIPKKTDNKKIFKFWKIGTINARTMKDNGKVLEVIKSINNAKLDIVGVQETKRIGDGKIKVNVDNRTQYNFYWKGYNNMRQHGVGIIIKKCNYIKIADIELFSPRILIARIIIHNLDYKIFVIYAPHECLSVSSKNSFYHDLKKRSKKTKKLKNKN